MTGAFIRDYLLWNDFSFQNYERTNDFGLASSAYDALVAKYAGPAKEHLLTTFSSHSSHSPTTTKIESAAYLEQSAKIVTLNEDVNGFITRYEYHYVQKGGVWLLDGLYYIDDYDNDARLPIL